MKVTPILKLVIELENEEPTALLRYLRSSLAVLDLHIDDESKRVAQEFVNHVTEASWDDYSFGSPK